MKTLFDCLPKETQDEIKKTLKAFPECSVWIEYGEHKVRTGSAVSKTYAPDLKYIGSFKDSDIFTESEMILNYVESFHEYPINYRGKRNYGMLDSLTWDSKVCFDELGNIVKA